MYTTEPIRSDILELLEQHDPNRALSINELMLEWKGKEPELLFSLCMQYKQKYTKMAPKKLKDLYKIGPKIGSGAFATVRKCLRKSDGQLFAMKIIKKSGYKNEEELKLLQNEINTMRRLHHPHIIQLHDVFESPSKVILIIDYCDGGGLFDAIIEKGAFAEKSAKTIFRKLCLALKYLHSQCIVHRDIKIEDLLFKTRLDVSSITLTDFGLCDSCANGPLFKPVGTPNYVAPEILQKQEYDTQVDMWTIGVILYIILAGFQPFHDENNDTFKLYEKIRVADYESMDAPEWKGISDEAKDCVRSLLQTDPKKRMTADDALRHPWIASMHKNDSIALVLGYIRSETQQQLFPLICPGIICDYYDKSINSNISV